MAIQSIMIINKSGGLIYNHNFIEPRGQMNSNDYLIIAGTLHSVFAIATQLTPLAVQINNKAAQNAESDVPYIAGIGVNTESKGGPRQLGSFMGPDYFQESFTNWNKSGLRHMVTDDFSMLCHFWCIALMAMAIPRLHAAIYSAGVALPLHCSSQSSHHLLCQLLIQTI
ncbi:hypothetical protein C6P41_003835 [Kluyveromyces marxianus]|nr:hypothetical protein C6P43_004282 [Kluyveromyces marxianus]KAG0682285.1 hypothetical protein C6P41_003835 [Kluyveromyces marxianus]